jgi:hypothetical protein
LQSPAGPAGCSNEELRLTAEKAMELKRRQGLAEAALAEHARANPNLQVGKNALELRRQRLNRNVARHRLIERNS